MEKKKIAFVVAIPATAFNFLKDHFVALRSLYDITLFANFPNEDSKNPFIKIGVSCIDVPIGRSFDFCRDLISLRCLTYALKNGNFESVHSVTPKAGFVSALAGWFARVPNRIHIFTGQVWATKSGIMRFLLKMVDKIIARLVTKILVDGESQRSFLIREGVLSASKSRVLANGSIAGVNMDRFVLSDAIRLEERAKFGFSDKDVVFIFLGRLNHDKGIGELYAAFNKLVIECPNAKLLLYGVDEEGYSAMIDKYVNIKKDINYYFPGKTSKPFEALQGADVFVLPTWREGFGSSVIEASALALPVITTDAYGVVDASIPNETGLRCKVNDPDGLYQCMKLYYDNQELRILHGKNGRKRVIEKFSNDIVSSEWVRFYADIFTLRNPSSTPSR